MISGRVVLTGRVSTALLNKLFPPWTSEALCDGQWELFDSDIETIMGVDELPWGMTPELYAGMQERDRRDAEAVRICWKCPVRQECLRDALMKGLEYTVRGGYTPHERRVISEGYEPEDWRQF